MGKNIKRDGINLLSSVEKYFSIGFLVYVLFYAFFYKVMWEYLSKPTSVFYFNIIFLVVPCIILLIPYVLNKRRLLFFSIQDCFFLLFLTSLLGSYFYAINPAFVLKGASMWLSLFLVYACFKWVFTCYSKISNQIILYLLCLFGLFFVLYYFIDNFHILLSSLSSQGSYDSVIKSTHSIIGLKNASASFIFMVLVTHFSISKSTLKVSSLFQIFYAITIIFLFVLISRNVYLGLVTFGGVYFLSKSKITSRIIFFLSFIAVVICVFVFLVLDYQTYFSSLGSDTLSVRLKLWSFCFDFFKANPIFGIGNFQWGIINSKFTSLAHPHNDFVRLLLELGVVGFLAYLGVYAIQFAKGIEHYQIIINKKPSLKLLFISLMSFMVLSFFDSIHFRISHGIILMLVLAQLDVLLFKSNAVYNLENKMQYVRNVFKYGLLFLGVCLLGYRYIVYENDRIFQDLSAEIKTGNISLAENAIQQINFNFYADDVKEPLTYKLGLLYLKSKDNERAIEYFEKTLERFPFNLKTAKSLYKLAKKTKDKDKVKYYFNLLKKINKYAIKEEIEKKRKKRE